jgi:hypothetical protein
VGKYSLFVFRTTKHVSIVCMLTNQRKTNLLYTPVTVCIDNTLHRLVGDVATKQGVTWISKRDVSSRILLQKVHKRVQVMWSEKFN